MDRFSAYLLVRRHLKHTESRNQALAVEAIMEGIAEHQGQTAQRWGVLGLLSQLDLEYAEQNPEARGCTARQQAELEGMPPQEATHLERWCQHLRRHAGDAVDELAAVEWALVAATVLAEETLPRPDWDTEATIRALSHDLELMRQRGDARGNQLDNALDRLSLTEDAAAQLCVAALRRIAQDLR